MRIALWAGIVPAILLSGCLYVAPIEEELPEEDTPPYITEQEPDPFIRVMLDRGADVSVLKYGDRNAGQTLHHRVVLDLRPAMPTSENAVISSTPREQPAGNRTEPVRYHIDPCGYQAEYPDIIAMGKTIEAYILISDAPFYYRGEDVKGHRSNSLVEPYKTQDDREIASAHWTLVLDGTCPPQD